MGEVVIATEHADGLGKCDEPFAELSRTGVVVDRRSVLRRVRAKCVEAKFPERGIRIPVESEVAEAQG